MGYAFDDLKGACHHDWRAYIEHDFVRQDGMSAIFAAGLNPVETQALTAHLALLKQRGIMAAWYGEQDAATRASVAADIPRQSDHFLDGVLVVEAVSDGALALLRVTRDIVYFTITPSSTPVTMRCSWLNFCNA